MYYSSLESSHNDESNGGKITFPWSLDDEILSETSKIGILYFYIFMILRRLTFRSISRHPMIAEGWFYHHSARRYETIPRDMSHLSTIIGCRDIKWNVKRRSIVKYKMPIYDISLNISASSDRWRMILPPFDSPLWDDSNELWHIYLWSLDADILSEM